MHVGEEAAVRWEGCKGLAHHLGSLFCLGLQTDLNEGPLPLGCALLLLSPITCTFVRCIGRPSDCRCVENGGAACEGQQTGF